MSFPRYPSYKDSGVEWLGEVPEHWYLSKIKHVARFFGGGTPSRDNLAFWGGDIPWVSPKDMKVELIDDAEERITQIGLASSTTSLVPPGRLLMVVRSGILKHTIPVAINTVEVALNQDMKALDFSEGYCESRFFLRWVQGLNDVLLLEWAKQGATVESIEYSYLAETVVPLPPSHEQTTIATFLDRETAKIDALAAEYRTLIDLLKEKRQAVISQAVTKGLDPTVPMKDSGVEWLGEVPAHWKSIKIKQLFCQAKRQGYPDLPVLSVYREYGVLEKDSRDDNNNKTPDDLDSYQRVNPGDLVINKMKAWQGSLGISFHEGITSPDYIVYASIHKESNDFLHYMLRQRNLVGAYKAISNGIRPQQWRLEPEEFENLTFFIPAIEEQDRIANFVSRYTAQFDALGAEAEQGIALLQERRTALISAAVTGKIDVRGLVSN